MFIVASDNLQMIWKLNHKKKKSEAHTQCTISMKNSVNSSPGRFQKILTWLEISEQWDINISNIQSFSVLICAVHRQYADCHVTFLILTEPTHQNDTWILNDCTHFPIWFAGSLPITIKLNVQKIVIRLGLLDVLFLNHNNNNNENKIVREKKMNSVYEWIYASTEVQLLLETTLLWVAHAVKKVEVRIREFNFIILFYEVSLSYQTLVAHFAHDFICFRCFLSIWFMDKMRCMSDICTFSPFILCAYALFFWIG